MVCFCGGKDHGGVTPAIRRQCDAGTGDMVRAFFGDRWRCGAYFRKCIESVDIESFACETVTQAAGKGLLSKLHVVF
jgi:hypothetical protein